MTSDESKLEILKKVEDGTLSIEEGSSLLSILDRTQVETAAAVEEKPEEHSGEGRREDLSETTKVSGCWKAAWSMVLWLGAGITALAGYWMYTGYERSGYSWGFWLSWIPLLLGIVLLIIGVILMQGNWINIRIKSKEEKGSLSNFTISVPLPLNFVSWVFQKFHQFMPEEVRGKNIGQMLEEMKRSIEMGEPFHVQVDEEDEQVEIAIG